MIEKGTEMNRAQSRKSSATKGLGATLCAWLGSGESGASCAAGKSRKKFRLTLTLAALTAFLALSTVPALALNPERRYEMVSPVYKGGFGALHIEGVRADGNAVAFFSPGAFGGEPAGFSEGLDGVAYMAIRGEGGWASVPLVPPDALSKIVLGPADFFLPLDRELANIELPNPEDPSKAGYQDEFIVHATATSDISANWQPTGIALETLNKEHIDVGYAGGSSDFCHILVTNAGEQNEEGHLLLGAKGASEPLYELVSGCNGETPELRLVALNGKHKLISTSCASEPGSGTRSEESGPSAFNAVADAGNEVFFTTCVDNNRLSLQLFVRLAGSRTLEISKPLLPKSPSEACGNNEIPCKGAETRANADFSGASEDGSRVFFTSKAPLVGASDTGRNLYEATIGCLQSEPECSTASKTVTSLLQVSRGANAGDAVDVQGVVRVAPDGSRVYFVARGVLGDGAGPQGAAPVKGADNLYVYEQDTRYPSGHLAFVADLCSGQSSSGEVENIHCPNAEKDTSLWLRVPAEAQTAGIDGRYLVFSSYGQLTSGDTDVANDVYRYDAQTGVLDRVSTGEAGYDQNGNNNAFDATINEGRKGGTVKYQYEVGNRAISEDGSRIVFNTSEPLSPDASNGLSDVYEWHQNPGHQATVFLISGGSAEAPVQEPVISPDGRDIFFSTTEGLAPEDTDGLADVYDARVGGGFPQAPAPRQQCSSDACQGPLTSPAPLLVPGSVSQAPGENLAAPVVPKPTSKSRPAKCRNGFEKRKNRCVKTRAKKLRKRSRGRN
jgi:hypothetical protein